MPLHKGSVSLTNSLYLNESLTSMMLVNGVNKVEGGEEGEPSNGVLIGDSQNLLCLMLHRIRYSVRTRHKLNLRFGYKLRNIETNEYTVWYKNRNNHWFSKLSQTKAWLEEQEELRLQGETIDRRNTKWVFDSTVFVDLKVILDRQPLQIGLGRLPDCLRNKREVISLDTFNDDLCIFRCIAVD